MNKYRGSFDWNSFSDFYTVLNVTPDDFQLAGRGQGEYHDGLQLQSYLFIRDEIAADLSREQKQAEIAKYPLSLYMQRKKLPVFIDSPFRGFTEFYEQDFRADIDNGEAC
jgi:hypothetical protein